MEYILSDKRAELLVLLCLGVLSVAALSYGWHEKMKKDLKLDAYVLCSKQLGYSDQCLKILDGDN